jgi:hypothetical protein
MATACVIEGATKKNSIGEDKVILVDIIIRSHRTIDPSRENLRTLPSLTDRHDWHQLLTLQQPLGQRVTYRSLRPESG